MYSLSLSISENITGRSLKAKLDEEYISLPKLDERESWSNGDWENVIAHIGEYHRLESDWKIMAGRLPFDSVHMRTEFFKFCESAAISNSKTQGQQDLVGKISDMEIEVCITCHRFPL